MRIPNNLPIPYNVEMWETLDSTKLQSFSRCPRGFFYEYLLGWRSEATSNHLSFGKAWHSALEHLYSKWDFSKESISQAYSLFLETYRRDFPSTTDVWFKGKTPENALLGLVKYCCKYADDLYNYELVDHEVGGIVAISEDRLMSVRLDLLLRDKLGTLFMEHKTGSTMGQKWADQWSLSIQIGAYLHALNSFYDQPKGRAIVNGVFFSTKTINFGRQPCMRSGLAMLSWLNTVNSLWDRIEYELEVLATQDASDPILSAFPLLPTSCSMYGGCQFHDLCVGVHNPLTLSGPPSGFHIEWFDPLEDVRSVKKKEN